MLNYSRNISPRRKAALFIAMKLFIPEFSRLMNKRKFLNLEQLVASPIIRDYLKLKVYLRKEASRFAKQ